MADKNTDQKTVATNAPSHITENQPQQGAKVPPSGDVQKSAQMAGGKKKPDQPAPNAPKKQLKKTPEQKAADARKKKAAKAAAARKKAAYQASMQEPYEHLFGDFPIAALKKGFAVRRKAWAPGFELTLSHKGSRGKRTSAFFQSGTRSGQIEWKPKTIDDLVADDWLVIMTVKQAIEAKLVAPHPNAADFEK